MIRSLRTISESYGGCLQDHACVVSGCTYLEVDESVPLEQALRSLTHWWHLRRYPESLGARTGVLEGEQDFFRGELEKMDWGDEVGGNEGDGEMGWGDGQVEGW